MHDGIIQIRSSRELTENEIRSILNIVERYRGRSEYEILESEGGFDIYFTGLNDARHTASKIKKVLGGDLKISTRFLRVESGRAIYRLTFRIKLPETPSRARYGF